MKRDSLGSTLLVSATVTLFCSLLVSGVVTLLRPIQLAQKAPQSANYILLAAGLIDETQVKSEQAVILEHLKKVEVRIIDLNTASFAVETEEQDFDYRQSMELAKASTKLSPKVDLALLQQRPNKMPSYWIHSSDSKAKLVVPIYGKGMWSMIHGYIALEEDLNTIAGVYFYQQSDTPGIGELIQAPKWLSSWHGKQIYNASGEIEFNIANKVSGGKKSAHLIDGITGATKTVEGVHNLIHFWFGDHGYRKFLQKQRQLL